MCRSLPLLWGVGDVGRGPWAVCRCAGAGAPLCRARAFLAPLPHTYVPRPSRLRLPGARSPPPPLHPTAAVQCNTWRAGKVGAFLVRPSKQTPGDFTIVVKDKKIKGQENQIINVKLRHDSGIYDLYQGRTFPDIAKLLQYYMAHPDKLHEASKNETISLKTPMCVPPPVPPRAHHPVLRAPLGAPRTDAATAGNAMRAAGDVQGQRLVVCSVRVRSVESS